MSKSLSVEDKLPTMYFKSWACLDLEYLAIKKSREFSNLKLLSNWTAQQLNKISYPISEHSVSQWTTEGGLVIRYPKKLIC